MKMANKNNRGNIQSVVNKLFEIAGAKMKDDHDKAVLEGLKKYV